MNLRFLRFIAGLMLCLVSSASAREYTALENRFAGFPQNTSQHGLNELSPALFATEGLTRETGCLAAAIYFEARGESRMGQIAVAQVIINRTKSRKYPDSICRVVWQNSRKRNRCQFSFTCDGRIDSVRDSPVWTRIKNLARMLVNTKHISPVPQSTNPIDNLDENIRRSTHYHATYVAPGWSRKLERVSTIGRHIFYVSARVERAMEPFKRDLDPVIHNRIF